MIDSGTMKPAGYIAAVVVLAWVAPAAAQIRGAPASVTSMAPWRGVTPGPPASVTSLGPNGFSSPCSGVGPLIPSAMGCTPTEFTSGFFFPDARDRGRVNLGSHRHRRSNTGAYYPVYVPYAYPVASEAGPEDAAEPDPPAPTIFERRPTSAAPDARYGSHYVDGRERQPATTPAPQELSPADARQQIPVVLIYRDGHEQEVTNYAIVGQTLYDLGTFVAHKIPLADLNLKATIKANDDRGVEFTVPTSVKGD
jgi:hypothetical protein